MRHAFGIQRMRYIIYICYTTTYCSCAVIIRTVLLKKEIFPWLRNRFQEAVRTAFGNAAFFKAFLAELNLFLRWSFSFSPLVSSVPSPRLCWCDPSLPLNFVGRITSTYPPPPTHTHTDTPPPPPPATPPPAPPATAPAPPATPPPPPPPTRWCEDDRSQTERGWGWGFVGVRLGGLGLGARVGGGGRRWCVNESL